MCGQLGHRAPVLGADRRRRSLRRARHHHGRNQAGQLGDRLVGDRAAEHRHAVHPAGHLDDLGLGVVAHVGAEDVHAGPATYRLGLEPLDQLREVRSGQAREDQPHGAVPAGGEGLAERVGTVAGGLDRVEHLLARPGRDLADAVVHTGHRGHRDAGQARDFAYRHAAAHAVLIPRRCDYGPATSTGRAPVMSRVEPKRRRIVIDGLPRASCPHCASAPAPSFTAALCFRAMHRRSRRALRSRGGRAYAATCSRRGRACAALSSRAPASRVAGSCRLRAGASAPGRRTPPCRRPSLPAPPSPRSGGASGCAPASG